MVASRQEEETCGRLAWMRPVWTEGRILPRISQATTREFIRVLAYPEFKLDEQDIQAALAAYLPFTETVDVAGHVPADCPRCSDEEDQMFVELGIAGRTEVLVSGDAALLHMKSLLPLVVETAAESALRFL